MHQGPDLDTGVAGEVGGFIGDAEREEVAEGGGGCSGARTTAVPASQLGGAPSKVSGLVVGTTTDQVGGIVTLLPNV